MSAKKSENSVPAWVIRRHLRRSSQRRFAYQSSLLGSASTSLTDRLPSRLSSLPVQRTTTWREPNLAKGRRGLRTTRRACTRGPARREGRGGERGGGRSPPRPGRRRSGGGRLSGGRCSSARCGRCSL